MIMKKMLIGYAILMLIFGFYDLNISLALFNNSSIFAEIFDRIGYFPMMILASLAFMILSFKSHKYLFMSLALIFDIIIVLAYSYFADSFSFIILLLAILLIYLEYNFAKKIYLKYQEEAIYLAKAIILFMTLAFFTTEILKIIWGRPRFRAMDNPLEEFKAWYILSPFGLKDEVRSFPSAHTTQAAMIIGLLFFNDLKIIKKRQPLTIFIIIWTISVALSRVIAGAHFASDVLTGMMVSYSAYYLIKHYYFNKHLNENQD